MAGHTMQYAIEPRGEYVFGVVAGEPMRARRARASDTSSGPVSSSPGSPSQSHSGHAAGDRPWFARLVVVEVADLAAIAGDDEVPLTRDVAFPSR
jgi:hypothetical protein